MDTEQVVVVCGAGGYVGGRLIEHLLSVGHNKIRAVSYRPVSRWIQSFPEVENISLDLRDFDACKKATAGAHWIYNLAAKVGGIGYIGKNRTECMLSALINMNLLRAAVQVQPYGYFFASSACVYGNSQFDEYTQKYVPIKESDELHPSKGYGEEKLFSERVCQEFEAEYRIPVRIARYHTIYGPGDDIKGAEGKDHAPAALCRKIIKAQQDRSYTIDVWGDGFQTRNFLYIDDCVFGTRQIMMSEVTRPLNLGSSETVSINQMIDTIEDIAGVKVHRRYKMDAPEGVRHRGCDNSLLCQFTGWEPSTPLRDGLEATYIDLLNKSKL